MDFQEDVQAGDVTFYRTVAARSRQKGDIPADDAPEEHSLAPNCLQVVDEKESYEIKCVVAVFLRGRFGEEVR